MTPLGYALLAYARMYVRNLPQAATHAVPELRPLELKISELIEDESWYCDTWQGYEHIVTFFYWANDDRGMDSRWSVDTREGTVTPL